MIQNLPVPFYGFLVTLISCLFRLSEAETTIIVLREEKRLLDIAVSETEGANQVLRDEHQALQIAYASIEEKLKILHVSPISSTNQLINQFLTSNIFGFLVI